MELINTPELSFPSANSAKSRIYQAAMQLFADSGGDELSVSELAQRAGLARGTIYNNVEAPELLFAEVVTSLSRDMIARTELTMRDVTDPAERIATGLRLFVRRAHEERDWGRFLVRFAASHQALHEMMSAPPARDIMAAIAAGTFQVEPDKTASLVSMLTGSTLAAMNAVIRGDQAWRQAGTDTAELFLRAGGVTADEARRIARLELAPLALAATPRRRSSQRRTS